VKFFNELCGKAGFRDRAPVRVSRDARPVARDLLLDNRERETLYAGR
jgi:hypothetical protein